MSISTTIQQFLDDAAIAHEIIHGDVNTVVQTEGGPVKSLAKVVADADPSGKQDNLVSGTNIKTVEGQSLLGSGNLDLGLAQKADRADTYTKAETYSKTETYTKSETDAKIAAVVEAAPATLDTLNELAAALGDDPNFAATMAAQIGSKASAAELDALELVVAAIPAPVPQSVKRVDRTADTTLVAADNAKLIDISSGTFTQTFAACATLGNGWHVWIRNNAGGDITLDPNGAETIDGLASFIMYPGEVRLVQCDGTALRSIVIKSFSRTFTADGNFIKPPGYSDFAGLLWGAGGSGGRSGTTGGRASGGGGGACVPFALPASALGASEVVTIGQGGAAITTAAAGNPGGISSLGTLIFAYGGGAGFFHASSTAISGGAGGGALSAGANGSTTPSTGGAPSIPATVALNIYDNTGLGGANALVTGNGGHSSHGGAAGGAGQATSSPGTNGGSSVFGGAGGGGTTSGGTGTGGVSRQGGNGGAGAAAGASAVGGTTPGGGGGGALNGTQSGAGARGELRIWGVL